MIETLRMPMNHLAAALADVRETTAARRAIEPTLSGGHRLRLQLPRACLIVEDEQLIANVIAEEVAAAGLVPVTAHSISEATIAIGQNNVVKAVVDFVLPDGDAAAFIQQTLAHAKIDHVVFTGHPDKARAKLPAGVRIFTKPDDWPKVRLWLREP